MQHVGQRVATVVLDRLEQPLSLRPQGEDHFTSVLLADLPVEKASCDETVTQPTRRGGITPSSSAS